MIIDIFSEVYTKLKTELLNVTVLPSYPLSEPTFPCAIVEELDNINDSETTDSAGEFANSTSYEINIYSNRTNKVSEVKTIRNSIDDIFSGEYGMSRNLSRPMPNFDDNTIYRYTLRYSFKIDKNKKIYRR